ncbi:MAG: AGE family epimerase/isomerase [Planctomycetaceae bacterium]
MPPFDLAALEKTYKAALLDDCVPFWFPRCVDEEHGGFLHCRDRDGALLDTDKSVWAQGRTAWMLLTLYNTVERRPEWLEWAEGGLRFLERHCFDADGRMFFHVARDGRPIRKRRYAYSEAFAAIAYAAHAKATGDERSASRARELFDLFTRWNFTPGLMPAKFTAERPTIGLAPRMIAIVTAQELRANLGDDAKNRGWIDRCINEIRTLFVKPERRCVMETVGPHGEILDHFDGRTLNPGHAIEGAWFILAEGKHRGDGSLVRLGCDMLDWMWERGWDREHGGLFYFRDVDDKPVQEYWHDMKFWWPHDEALVATLLAWTLTGESRYADRHGRLHDWSFGHFADDVHGEWYGYLHRDGRISVSLKGNLWKSFFHHPRCLWHCWRLCDASRRGDVPRSK